MKTAEIFTCPRCGKHRLEEVMIDVVQTTIVEAIEEMEGEDELALDYGDHSCEEGAVARYQCVDCGEIVADGPEELKEFLFGTKASVDGEVSEE